MWSGVALVAHLAVRVRHIGIVLCGLKQVVQAGQLALRPTHDAQSLANTLQGILRNAQLLGRVMAAEVEYLHVRGMPISNILPVLGRKQ